MKRLSCLLLLNLLAWNNTSALSVVRLQVDFMTSPLGIDNPAPGFSWQIESSIRNTMQQAYEIIVSTDSSFQQSKKGQVWNSGRIAGGKTSGIPYQGKPLLSFTRYYWWVRVWDMSGVVSEWSSTSWFETSMMNPADWKGVWIGDNRDLPRSDEDYYKDIPNPILRKDILVKKRIKSARLYAAGLGYSVVYINGQRVGDNRLDMPWTNFSKQILYSTFDVTSLLIQGKNTLAAMLGNGWYNPLPIRMFQRWNFRNTLAVGKPCMKAQLRIEYADGSVDVVPTDQTWHAGEGPVLMNSVYLGETYDATKEQDGWNLPGFDFSSWPGARIVEGPAGQLVARYLPPVKITRVLKPIRMFEPWPGVYVYDFGQNFAGVPRLRATGPAGTRVVMRSGEDLHADGTLNYLTVITAQLKSMWNLKGGPGCPSDPMMINTYVMKGKGEEVYAPEFTFSGFRYVELTGYPGRPDLNTIEGLRMNTDLEPAGSFACSNPLFNQLQEMVQWTFLSNVFSVQSDCPAREKLGYGADAAVTAEAFCYNFNMAAFYRKTVQDWVNDVRQSGGMPEIAPDVGINEMGFDEHTGSPGWQLAFPYGLKVLYGYYGDRPTIEKHYPVLKKQVEFMHQRTPQHIVEKCISDHESLDKRPVALSATAFYFHHVKILSEFAALLNLSADAERYGRLATEIKEAYIQAFLKPGTGIFDSGTQSAQVISFYYNLVPEIEKQAAFDRLVSEIFNRHKGHLATGIFGTKFLFDYLREINRNDIAYAMANQRGFPGYGNMVANGATTLYESWEYPDTAASQNHPMFGSVSEWFYKSLLGIVSDAPGFTRVIVKPQPAGDLVWARGYHDAQPGKISSQWRVDGTRFHLKVGIPPNTRATIYVPALPNSLVLEGGKPATECADLIFKGYAEGYALFETGSGKYEFQSVFQK